ncbi:MAG: delta-class carbonic anhydrase [Roseovarius sp.]
MPLPCRPGALAAPRALFALPVLLLLGLPGFALAQSAKTCWGFGPQTPRDISQAEGRNARLFSLAPAPAAMNLCNIHTHTSAEHKGPGFQVFAGYGTHGGYRCNETDDLTPAELADPAEGTGAFHGAEPGDTIEVHWVFTSCAVAPGEGLGACLSSSCANPQLRVESQVFLVVNDPETLDFTDFGYYGHVSEGYHQPRSLPAGTGEPVVFHGSTTGPKYSARACSPMQVTWSVRPNCARLDIASLHRWAAEGNVFNENHSHGVRRLVTAPELLSPIETATEGY